MSLRILSAMAALAAAACTAAGRLPEAGEAPAGPMAGAAQRRAILVSFDSFSERRALETLDTSVTPAIRALFDGGACADHAVPHFPSVTAPGHAALWTGAYGNVNGVSANTQPQLPRDRHDIMQLASGFSADALRAEPIWISAGRAGRVVVAHHVTQAPGPPGYRAVTGERGTQLAVARERAERTLAMPNVHVLNGYNTLLAGDTVLTELTAPPRPATEWRGTGRLGRTLPPREVAWLAGPDSVFALLFGDGRYDRVLVAPVRDASRGVTAAAATVERESPRRRPLARHFSDPLELEADGRTFFLRLRLFELAPDGSSFMIYQPKLVAVDANRGEVESAYNAAVRGWIGNGASRLYERDVLGRTLMNGGDGTAELRYLESQELLTRQFIRGAEWAWRTVGAELLADYFPLGDEIDHMWLGFLDGDSPRYDARIARALSAMRERAWAMLDIRLEHLQALVASDPNAVLFVSGDHGMRTSWRVFRPNAALREAGLLALDTAGRVDVTRTRAVAPGGYYVMVNRREWRGGIVSPREEQAVLEAAERALLAARTPEETPIVTRIFRAAGDDSLGLGGPVGGDIYYETARGYRWSWDPRGAVTQEADAAAGHGFPSTAPDMYTVFCAWGAGFAPRRIPGVRTITAAPTASEWLGVPAPADAQAPSVLSALLGRGVARDTAR